MNLYEYLKGRPCNAGSVARAAKEAYERFRAHGRTLVPEQDCDPFVFAYVDSGYQAFTFKPDQVVENGRGELAIVTGWKNTVSSGWLVRVKTADGEYDSYAENLKPAAFPEGLVEILRGKVHDKVDEAFA